MSTNNFATPRTSNGSTARTRVSAACNDDKAGAARKNNRSALGMRPEDARPLVRTLGCYSTLWFTSAIADTTPATGATRHGQLSNSGYGVGAPRGS